MEYFRIGARGKAKKGKTLRERDGWSKMEHDKPRTDIRGYQRQRHMKKLSFG
jgi:hypothetical protein